MTGMRLKAILSAVSVTALLLCVLIPVGNNATDNVIVNENVETNIATAQNAPVFAEADEPIAVAAGESHEELSAEQLEARLLGMLNFNHCFNSSLNDEHKLAKCAAVSLIDYAQDKVGYGLCVSAYLIEGFVESFYGVKIPAEQMLDESAPKGYISLMGTEAETLYHKTVTLTETEEGYEMLTCLYSYSGGEEYETCLVKSRFVKNPESEFGFNLVYCETL